jgi:hypothetical protein
MGDINHTFANILEKVPLYRHIHHQRYLPQHFGEGTFIIMGDINVTFVIDMGDSNHTFANILEKVPSSST